MAPGAGEGDELKLLGAWPSPFMHRVRLALHLKGITNCECVEDDLTNKSDLLLASNPVHKKVPILLHGGRPVCESLVILQCVEDAFSETGHALLPADPYDRAVARFWVAYADDIFFGAWIKSLKGTTEDERAVRTAGELAALQTLEATLTECSKGKPFFAGDAPGYVDVAPGGYLGWMRAYEAVAGVNLLDTGRTPLLVAWAEHFAAPEAAKGVIPEVDQIVQFAKVLQARTSTN